ncbi:protein translocase subunit SecDF [Flavobacterium sp. NST-5]|uniref:Multifunctional fusion protein n=1 Tax=Flavobacterium ichthyis TaxID=2698827 RepID=A0ABW9ZB11_9FLAO|nr:protein translocase subunit SecDF [Flavobacterium ichthyis]NBL65321.1 protein translocase subunit SecDF [Flavobacterium ichthyis]
MQNRGLVKFFAILFALVSIYQLSFTFVANKVKSDAKAFAQGDDQKELKYLDSISKVNVYNLGFTKFTYEEVADKQIQKGLDLEGGINVILQISVKDVLKTLANDSKNPVFLKALETADKNRAGNQDYIDAFFAAFDQESKGTVRLADPEIFAHRNLEEVNIKMSDAQVTTVVRTKVKESVESAFRVLQERIDKFGVVQPNIQMLGESGRILVELPGAKDVDRIKKLLQSTAQLEFWETYKVEEMSNFLMATNELLKKTEVAVAAPELPKTGIDTLLTDASKDSAAVTGANPLVDKFTAFGSGPVLGYFSPKDTAAVNKYLNKQEVKSLLAGDQRYAKFVWSKEQTINVLNQQIVDPKVTPNSKKVEVVELYALKGNRQGTPSMSGAVVTDASDKFDQMGKPSVEMVMNSRGAKDWESLTGKAYAERGFIAIVLDDVVYSAPGVTSGAITGGISQITGNFDIAETKDLANILRAGKLPASADIVQFDAVGPSLGQEAIDNGITSALVGLLLVSLWMIIYYGKSGWFANIALAVNLLFLFGILASIGAILTLPGIAGIVLTMGTAVDANIIIYERAKEELRLGHSLEEAIKTSFSWRGAMSSITDANVTHILTGAVLFIFGTGPIKGFATTLLIGIFTSLFTAIFITRILLEWSVNRGDKLTFVTGFSKNLFTKFNFDFLGKKKITYAISGVVVLVSVASFFINGFDQGVDFVGGRTLQVRFEKPVEASVVSEELSEVFGSVVQAKVLGDDQQLKIVTKYKIEDPSTEADVEVNKMLFDNLKKYYNADITYEKFVNAYDGKQTGIMQSSKVGPAVAQDIKTNSIWAVLGAMAIVFLYLMVSFRKWQYSLGAIAAVAHDVIFVLGVYSLCYKFMPFHMELDQHFIAAILTVIGYSMNDTVIVFDRVREYLAGRMKGNFKQIVNSSVNTTMSRTINTSLTMIIVLLIMFVFGGDSIRGFIFAMLIGILVGTYSSLFIATPVLVDSIPESEHKRIEDLHNAEEVA